MSPNHRMSDTEVLALAHAAALMVFVSESGAFEWFSQHSHAESANALENVARQIRTESSS